MKFRFVVLISAVALFFCCHDGSIKKEKRAPVAIDDYGGFESFPIEQRFTLPYKENLQMDSNSLMFFRTYSFDTSLLIHFRKTDGVVKAICYEMLPAYHKNINDYADKDSHLVFFDGYSFTLDSIQWESVRSRAGQMLADTNTMFKNEKCADCGFGMIAHDFKVRRTTAKTLVMYDTYARWLKDSILKKCIERKKPFQDRVK